MQPNPRLETPLPRALRRQMERVSALQAQQRAGASSNAAPTPPATVPDGGAANDTNVPEPAATPAAAAPVPSAPPAQAPAAPAADQRENDPAYWRERFRVMQGINATQRTEHGEALATRDRELTDLRARVQELEQQLAARPAGGSDKLDLSLFFKPEQIERFGEDQCEAMARAAIAAANSQAQQILDAEVKPLKERAKADDDRKVADAEAKFWKELGTLVPDFNEINADQAWLDWLTDLDDDGEQRQKRLNRHRNARNAQGVANVFKDFLKSKQPSAAPPVAAPRGASGGGGNEAPPANVAGKGYPTREEIRDYTKRSATIRNPRDPRFVTDKEKVEFEARLKLPRPGG